MITQKEYKNKLIKLLDKIKKDYPELVIVMDTPGTSKECKIGDAIVYEDPNGHIVIDAE